MHVPYNSRRKWARIGRPDLETVISNRRNVFVLPIHLTEVALQQLPLKLESRPQM